MPWILSCRIAGTAFLLLLFPGCQLMQPGKGDATGGFATPLARFQDDGSFPDDPVALGPEEKNPRTGTNQPAVDAGSQAHLVKQVVITGNQRIPEHQLLRHIRTRPGRYFDPDMLQQDVNQLWKLKGVRRVNGPYLDHQPDGIIVTFDISERPVMDRVVYIGNRALTDRKLAEETGLEDGQPLDMHSVRMARSRIEDLYHEKGHPDTQVTIVEGDEVNDREVVFLVHEDELQRVSSVTFEGNKIASDGRLRSFIKMKPGVLWLFGGKTNRREMEQDEIRLTAYYRALGFFNARIGRQLTESENGRWLAIRYFINEGPRYRVRSVSFAGNEKYSTEELASVVKLKPREGEAPEFNAAKMNEDVSRLSDLYGSQGYVFANVEVSPDFLEQPGLLDLVYRISEGEQYRVGEINVVIDGEYGITKRQVVHNRLGLRSGDLIDTRLLRDAEARLARSQLFTDGVSAQGAPPRVVVRPPELEELGKILR